MLHYREGTEMKPSTKKLLYSLIALIALTLAMTAYAETGNFEKTFSVGKGGTLYLESGMGTIKVGTWEKGEVFVSIKKRARNKERLDGFEVQIEQNGNDIHVRGDKGWDNRVRVEFQVNVPKEYNVDLSTGGGSIDVSDINGNVKLHTSGGSIAIGDVDGGDVDARTSGGTIKVGDVKGDLKVDTSGGSINLGKITGSSTIHTSGGSISVAQGGSDTDAYTSGGGINIGPSKGNVKVRTSGGGINIATVNGDVDADTSGGSIRVEGSKGKTVIRTSGGTLTVNSSDGPVMADTSGGDIKIMQAKGAIDARTSGGSIAAEMIETDNSKDTHVSLSSSGGDITVYLPETIEATVSATIKISRFANRDYQIYTDFPLSAKGEGSSRISAEGAINGGGDRIQIDTSNGDVYIKKL
jgi:DUF4097 and DUF4098 domain-containing protein YvlB